MPPLYCLVRSSCFSLKCILSQHVLENTLHHCISHYKDIQKIIIFSQRAKSLNFMKIGKEKKIKDSIMLGLHVFRPSSFHCVWEGKENIILSGSGG